MTEIAKRELPQYGPWVTNYSACLQNLIARQITLSGEKLVDALDLVGDDEFYAELPDGLSAAWVTGHLACTAAVASSWFDGDLLFPGEVHAVFNETRLTPVQRSRADSVGREAHPKELLLFRFRQAMVKAIRTLYAFDPEAWNRPGPGGTPLSLPTGGAVWEFLGQHTPWHMGALAAGMPRFQGKFALNLVSHQLYVDPQ